MADIKYTISINQVAAYRLGLDLDFIDLAIFDYIKDFFHSDKILKIEYLNETYFWVAHTKIIEDMPLLGIKTKQGIFNRIDKLIAAGLLVRCPASQQLQKPFYRFGPNYQSYISYREEKGGEVSLTPAKKFLEGGKQNLGAPINENLEDKDIIDTSIIYPGDNNTRDTREAPFDSPFPINFDNQKEKDCAERETVFTPAQVVASPRSRGRKEVPPHHFEQDPFYNFDLFVQQFAGQEFAGIDLRYYYNSAADWSASKTANKKSDWIATVRNWIRRDISEGKVRRIQPSGGGLDEGAINYLNMLANL